MDTKFQTSFIPKKPILADQGVVKVTTHTSVFMLIAILLFTISISAAGALFFWKGVLLKNQAQYTVDLKKAEERFDTETINKLKKANTKIDLAKTFLKNHIAASEIFSIIGGLTIDGVRFKSFDFGAPAEESEGVKISMKGVGNNFSSIAYQSDVFGQSVKFGKNKLLKNPIMSDLSLDDTGSVSFTFTATVDPADLSYEKTLSSGDDAQSGSSGSSGSRGTVK